MLKNRIALTLLGSALLGSLFVAVPALAATSSSSQTGAWGGGAHRTGSMMPGVFGTVSAINGSSITLTSKAMMRPGSTGSSPASTAATTYTVDAANATVFKDNATSSLSSVATGDTLFVQGTVSGTSVTAKTIRDGMAMMGARGGTPGKGGPQGSPIQGNGEPVVGGSVTAVSGSTLTVSAKAGVTYSIDASSAVIKKGNATSTVSAITVGDSVVVQGTVNGNSVVASSVLDQQAKSTTSSTASKGPMGGVLGAIGGFFQHIFGWF